MGEQPEQSTLRDVQGVPSAGAFMKEVVGYTAYIGWWFLRLLIAPIWIITVALWASVGQSQALGALAGGFIGLVVVTVVMTYAGWNA